MQIESWNFMILTSSLKKYEKEISREFRRLIQKCEEKQKKEESKME